MSGFVDSMQLKGMAEEDIWFARRDRELKEAMKLRKAQQERQDDKPEPAITAGKD